MLVSLCNDLTVRAKGLRWRQGQDFLFLMLFRGRVGCEDTSNRAVLASVAVLTQITVTPIYSDDL